MEASCYAANTTSFTWCSGYEKVGYNCSKDGINCASDKAIGQYYFCALHYADAILHAASGQCCGSYPYKRPKVKGGWDALLIRDEDEFPDDIKEVRSKFWWWVREEFGLAKEIGDIDEYRDFTEDEKEAFNTAFKPLWNGGKCKVRFYHDGRRFYHKKQFWLQTWDTKEEKFYWTSESTGKKTYLNPQPTAGELIARNARSQKEKAKENLKRGALWAKENAKWAAREGLKNGKILANKAYHKYQQRGMDKAEQDLYRMGFDRDIVLRTAEMAGTEDFEAAVQQAHYYQVLKDQNLEERRAYLEKHPPISVRFSRAVVAGYSTIRAWMKGTPQMTEEERRKQAIEMMRLAMYGQTGGPGEDSEVETSDEEKYMVQW